MVIIDRFLEARDTLNWPYRTAPPTSPVLKPEKAKDSPTPVQDDQLMNEFFEVYKEYKAYTSLSDSDLRKVEMKKGFFRGLNQEAKIKFAHEEPSDPLERLCEILVKLDVPLYLKLEILTS
jgi:hypothetical protein